MKKLILTIAATTFATIFSSCCCSENATSYSARQIDSNGRLTKEVLHDGNYNTYEYSSTNGAKGSVRVQQSAPTRSYNMDWKPRLP